MEATTVGFGVAEWLMLLCGVPWLGLPPGERDPFLIKSPPANSYVYVEWTAPGTGVAGAPGIQGFLADPEVKTFLTAVGGVLRHPSATDQETNGEVQLTLRSELPKLMLLAAKHPGGLFVAHSHQPIGDSHRLPLEAAVILHLGDDRDEMIVSLNNILSLIPGFEPPAKFQHTSVPFSGITLVVHEEGPRLLMAIGEGTLETVLARWQQNEGELALHPAFTAGWQVAKLPEFGSLAWWNLATLRADLQAHFGVPGQMIHNVAQSLGLSQIDSVITVSGLDQHDAVTRTQVTVTGPGDGLLMVLSGQPVTAAELNTVPADADFVAAISLDLSKVHQTARELVAKIAPDVLPAFDEFQKQLELEFRLNLADVFQGFGGVWTAYDAPSHGGVLLTGMVVAVPVRDARAAEVVYRRLMEMLSESLPTGADDDQTTLRELSFEGETIHYLNSAGFSVRYAGHPPVSPAFCLTKQQLLIALHPQALKAHLRFLQTAEPRFAATAATKIPTSRDEQLAVLYADTPRIGQAVYPLIPMLLKPVLAEMQAQGMNIDVAAIPSARAVLPYLQPAAASLVRRPDGFLIEQRNLLPLWMSLLSLPQGGSWDDGEHVPLEGRRAKSSITPEVQLGEVEGVVPAKAEEPVSAEIKEPTAVEKAARRTLPILVRNLIPDDVESLIPSAVFERLAAPPDPEKAAERERRRERRAERRALRQRRPPIPAEP